MLTLQERPQAPDVQYCVTTLRKCHQVCLDTLQYIERTGAKDEAELLSGIDYCAHVSRVAADFLSQETINYRRFFYDCAEIFENFGPKKNLFNPNLQLNACAEICQQAALQFKRMAFTAQLHSF